MEKNTFARWGWVVCVVIVIAILMGLATPFGNFIVVSVRNSLKGLNEKANNVLTPQVQPGLYDANDNLVASWEELINTYGMDIENNYTSRAEDENLYLTKLSSPYNVLKNNSELSNGVKLVIDSSVKQIGDYALYSCRSLTSVVFEKNSKCERIGKLAFMSCTSLNSLTIENSLKEIGLDAFGNCPSLSVVNFIGDIEDWLNIDFASSSSNPGAIGDLHFNGKLVEEVVVPRTITSIGDYAFYKCDKITKFAFEEGSICESIGWFAFYWCTSLKTLELPQSLQHIEEGAFAGCGDAIETVNYKGTADDWVRITFGKNTANPCGDGALLYCNNELLTEVVVPADVTSISPYAFFCNYNLTHITIHENVTNIGRSAFQGCRYLEVVTYEGTKEQWDAITKDTQWNYNIGLNTPQGMTLLHCLGDDNNTLEVAPGLYSSGAIELLRSGDVRTAASMIQTKWSDLLDAGVIYATDGGVYTNYEPGANSSAETLVGDLVLPSDGSITALNNHAFAFCSNLTDILFPNSLTSIGEYAFISCTNLTNITLPNQLLSIGENAFINCSGLVSINIPSSVESIEAYAFMNCTSLNGVSFEEDSSLTEIKANTFYGCTSLTSIDLPEGIESIGGFAFYNSGLTEISIPDSVKTIGAQAFLQCANLEAVTFGANSELATIKTHAFYSCTALTTIAIPKNTATIEDFAFTSSTNLSSVTVLATTPPELGSNVFAGTDLSTIKVPTGTADAYSNSWSSYASFITEN